MYPLDVDFMDFHIDAKVLYGLAFSKSAPIGKQPPPGGEISFICHCSVLLLKKVFDTNEGFDEEVIEAKQCPCCKKKFLLIYSSKRHFSWLVKEAIERGIVNKEGEKNGNSE